jgi:hypothetical protein
MQKGASRPFFHGLLTVDSNPRISNGRVRAERRAAT